MDIGSLIITASVPVFLVAIAVEAVLSRRLGFYRLNDSLSDLSCGVLNQVISAFTAVALTVPYAWLYARGHLLDLDEWSAGAWVLSLLGVDLAYYWFHRTSHRQAWLWGIHGVHHQSEDYNFAVALRQPAIEPWFTWVFRLPLAVLGVPPLTMLAGVAVNTVFQFFVHTRLVDRLGPLEAVLNTPSHHRVHHGRNPEYLDKNYSGMFIVWDRLFGTFEPEQAPVVYGVTKPLASWNPLWANVEHFVATWRRARSWGAADRARVWVMPPGWEPGGTVAPGAPLDAPRYDARSTGLGTAWSVAWFGAAVVGMAVLSVAADALEPVLALALGAWVAWTLLAVGGLQEGRRWARLAEPVRVVAGLLVVVGVAATLGT